MSHAGPRRPLRNRPAAPVPRFGVAAVTRLTAALAALTVTAAVAVPAALAPDGPGTPERAVRGAAAGALIGAPTDQIRAREWHLNVLRAQRAWRYSRGSGVTVAVLDTGVDGGHPDLTRRVVAGADFTGGARRPGGAYWGLHGTSMASIIAGHGHGPGLAAGMMGVAPQSRILSVRVTLENDDPLRRGNAQATGGDRDAVALGIRYAVDHGATIINMSLGGGRLYYEGTPTQAAAIKYALSRNVVLIASAGNDGSGADRKNFPAAYPGVIAVGALDRDLRLWKDSNRHSRTSVCAPGVDIVSADARDGYVVGTGTSASSAMVAGVAALIRARYPRLTPEQVRQALVRGSLPRRGHPTGTAACAGTVDAARSLAAASRLGDGARKRDGEPAPPAATPEPAAAAPEQDSGLLLPAVLGGGGLLIVLGLVLGWRQRRRPADDEPDAPDASPSDYGLPPVHPQTAAASGAFGGSTGPSYGASAPYDEPAEPPAARVRPFSAPLAAEPLPAEASPVGYTPAGPVGVPPVAPVNAPLWQSNEVFPATDPFAAGGGWNGDYAEPPPVQEEAAQEYEPEPYTPEHDDVPGSPPQRPRVMATSELRPFVPGEFSYTGLNGGKNGHANGNGHTNGHGNGHTNGHGNGHTNGHTNGHANGNGYTNGHGHTNGNGVVPNGKHQQPPAPDADPGTNGHDLRNGGHGGASEASPVDSGAFDDETWERFRRSALEGTGLPEIGTVPPEPPPGPPAPPPEPPPIPPAPPAAGSPDDEPRGRHSRRPGPADDEDYRPPWW